MANTVNDPAGEDTASDVIAYKVMTMCHCDERSDDGEPVCDDHWAVGIPTSRYDEESGHVGSASHMTEGFHTRSDAQLFADAKNAAV